MIRQVDEIYAYASSVDNHPTIIDISDPEAPVILSDPFGPDPVFECTGIEVHDGYLYELRREIGMQVWELY